MESQTYIFFGAVGAGKGTQIELLAKHLESTTNKKVLHVYPGGMFRKVIEAGGLLGERIAAYLNKGILAPDFMTDWIVTSFLKENITGNEHILFDAYPRNIHQAEIILQMIQFFDLKNIHIVFIEVSKEEATTRMLKRGRPDDSQEGIARRLQVFEEEVMPAFNFLKEKYPTVVIQGENTVEAIHEDIKKALNLV